MKSFLSFPTVVRVKIATIWLLRPYILAFLASAESEFPASINIKFMESGHTNMECDSMHACIENASKLAKICVPDDWKNVITMAKRTGTPYSLNQLGYQDFIDFRNIQKVMFPNMKWNTDGNPVQWTKMK